MKIAERKSNATERLWCSNCHKETKQKHVGEDGPNMSVYQCPCCTCCWQGPKVK